MNTDRRFFFKKKKKAKQIATLECCSVCVCACVCARLCVWDLWLEREVAHVSERAAVWRERGKRFGRSDVKGKETWENVCFFDNSPLHCSTLWPCDRLHGAGFTPSSHRCLSLFASHHKPTKIFMSEVGLSAVDQPPPPLRIRIANDPKTAQNLHGT